jgi:molybdate transport system regulatory protein
MAEPRKDRSSRKPSRFGRHPRPGYAVQSSVWIEKDGELYLGGGRVMLLEGIDRLGSISAAARSMKLTYRNAWLWIESMNRLAPAPLVTKETGGTGGGHAQLTAEGHKAIARYHGLRTKLEALVPNSKRLA